MSATQPTFTTGKDSLPVAPTLLQSIRADQIDQHARRLAMLEDPATVARIAIAESLAADLVASGFDPFHQQIFSTDSWHGDGDVSIIIHADIRAEHWTSGNAALADIIQRRGGSLGPGKTYTEAGHSIDLSLHATDYGRGWAPIPAEHVA